MDEKMFPNVETRFSRLETGVSYGETEVSNYGNAKKLMALYFLVSRNNFP